MINIEEEKLKAAIQIILGSEGVYTDKLEKDLVRGIKALSICQVSRSKRIKILKNSGNDQVIIITDKQYKALKENELLFEGDEIYIAELDETIK